MNPQAIHGDISGLSRFITNFEYNPDSLKKPPKPEILTGKAIEFGLGLAGKISKPWGSPAELQKKELYRLIKRARGTAFGLHYDFEQLLESDDLVNAFRQAVPIFDYNRIYDEWWHRTYAGEKDVCWIGRVKYFAMSSGTSNAPSKFIPVTRAMVRILKKGAFRMFASLPDFKVPEELYTKAWLAIGGTSQLEKKDKHYLGYLSGINANVQPIWARAFYKPGMAIAKIEDMDQRMESIAENAPDWNIGVLVGIPHWVQQSLQTIIEKHKLSSISEIWPDLSLFVSGGVAYQPYRKTLEKLVGKELIFMNTYLASEGLIAFQTRPETPAMALQLDSKIFFEFLPFNQDHFDDEGELTGQPPTLTIEDVKENVEYALIISTCSGAWRYLLGDTVKFTDIDRSEIVISGRTKHFLNLCSEHLTLDNMNDAIHKVETEMNIEIPEFTVSGIRNGIYFSHKWYIGSHSNPDKEKLTHILDMELERVNDDYKSERGVRLGLEVELVKPELFYQWQKATGNNTGQSKVPRVMKPNQFSQFEVFVGNQKS